MKARPQVPVSRRSQRAPARRNESLRLSDTAWQRIQGGDLETASIVLDLADECHPGLGEVAHLRGIIAVRRGCLTDAVALFREALRSTPGSAEYRVSLAAAIAATGQIDEALALLDDAIRLAPRLAEAPYNRGVLLGESGRWAEAEPYFRKALELRPDFPSARYNLALATLYQRPSLRGWAAYEARWDCPNFRSPRPRPGSPPWLGREPLPGHLLLVAEQGIGDTILFARFIPLLALRGAQLSLIAPAALHSLLARSFPGLELLRPDDPVPAHDAHCPLASLPLALGVDDLSGHVGGSYLRVGEERLACWQPRLAGEGLRVGLVWAGGPDHRFDARRSLAPDLLAPLLALPGVRWFSLQCGPAREALAASRLHPQITDLAPQLVDFDDTAAALSLLDLVITVDTSVANLAGAIGAPAWVLLDSLPDWRWSRDDGGFAWYPHLRTFRQQRAGDWPEVVDRVGNALRNFGQTME